MTPVDFFSMVFEHQDLYVFSFFFLLAIYFALFREYRLNFFDPMFTTVVFTTFASTTPLFLLFTGTIDLGAFLAWMASEVAFLVGYKIYRRPTASFGDRKGWSIDIDRYIHWYFLLYALSQLASYVLAGIPILLQSRLEIYTSSNVLLTRVTETYQVAFIALFAIYYTNRKNKIRNVYLAFVLATLLAGGSKTAIFGLFLTGYSAFFFYSPGTIEAFVLKNKAKVMSLLFLIFGLSFLVIYLFESNDFVFFFAYRLGMSGDSFFMSLPNEIWRQIVTHNNWVLDLFESPLKLVGIVGDETIVPLGFQLTSLVNHIDMLVGPNPRHNILGLVIFGAPLHVLFSFSLGLFISWVRNRMASTWRVSSFSLVFFVLLYTSSTKGVGDFYLMLAGILNCFIIFVPTHLVLSEITKFIKVSTRPSPRVAKSTS